MSTRAQSCREGWWWPRPHYVGEYQDLLWVSLKGSGQVLAINHTDPRQCWLYQAKPHPIFVARHPDTGEFYASQDESSTILRIDHHTKTTTQLPIPAEQGSTPVGLVAGSPCWVPPSRAAAPSDASTATVRSPGCT